MQTLEATDERTVSPSVDRGGWSYSQLAAWWNVSPKTIRRLVANGTLEIFRVAGVPRVTDESRRRVEAARARPAAA